MKSFKTLLAATALSTAIVFQPTQAQAVDLTSFLPGLDPGISAAIDMANSYVSVITNLLQGQLPSLNQIKAMVGKNGGFEIGGYSIGTKNGSLTCNAVRDNGEIDLSNTLCGDVASAIQASSDGNLPLPVATLITTASRISAQSKNIQDSNQAIAEARKTVLTATGTTITQSNKTIATQGVATTNANSTFARVQATNQIALQGVAVQNQALGIAANQLTTSAQGNRINSAQLSISQAKAEQESLEAQAKARYNTGLAQNASNAQNLQRAMEPPAADLPAGTVP